MTDLKSYIETVKLQIREGLGEDAALSGHVTLELSTTLGKSGGAGLAIQVIELGGKVTSEEIHKITIPFKLLTALDKAKEKAEMEVYEGKSDMVRGI